MRFLSWRAWYAQRHQSPKQNSGRLTMRPNDEYRGSWKPQLRWPLQAPPLNQKLYALRRDFPAVMVWRSARSTSMLYLAWLPLTPPNPPPPKFAYAVRVWRLLCLRVLAPPSPLHSRQTRKDFVVPPSPPSPNLPPFGLGNQPLLPPPASSRPFLRPPPIASPSSPVAVQLWTTTHGLSYYQVGVPRPPASSSRSAPPPWPKDHYWVWQRGCRLAAQARGSPPQ